MEQLENIHEVEKEEAIIYEAFSEESEDEIITIKDKHKKLLLNILHSSSELLFDIQKYEYFLTYNEFISDDNDDVPKNYKLLQASIRYINNIQNEMNNLNKKILNFN